MNRLLRLAILMGTIANAQFSPKAYFLSKSIIIPHDDKKHRGGEDAAAADQYTLVVADGVGGWANYGIDPGLFSKSLVKQVLQRNQDRPTEHIRTVVFIGNEQAKRSGMGTATLVTVRIQNQAVQTLNIGDSGYSIFRYSPANELPITKRQHLNRLQIVYQSLPGQKSFNFPDQIGFNGDSPMRVGDIKEHQFVDKDIYVLYSDGVSDNLFIDGPEVQECIARYLDQDGIVTSLSAAADCIAIKSYHAGKDEKLNGPFAIGAREAGMPFIGGGKQDDITVTVAQLFIDVPGQARRIDPDFFKQETLYVYTGVVGTSVPDYVQSFIKEEMLEDL